MCSFCYARALLTRTVGSFFHIKLVLSFVGTHLSCKGLCQITPLVNFVREGKFFTCVFEVKLNIFSGDHSEFIDALHDTATGTRS